MSASNAQYDSAHVVPCLHLSPDAVGWDRASEPATMSARASGGSANGTATRGLRPGDGRIRAALFRAKRVGRSDTDLVRDCVSGDQAAWNELVERYGRLVYSIALKVGLGAADADDVFQTVFSIVLRRLESLRDQERLSAWLIRTTYRESWRHAKRLRGRSELPDEVSADDEPSGEDIERNERQHIVRQALRELGGPCKDLLEALFFTPEEPRYDEIAGRLGIKIGSIGPTRARCFAKLQKLLAPYNL